MKFATFLLFLLFLTSCGSNNQNSKKNNQNSKESCTSPLVEKKGGGIRKNSEEIPLSKETPLTKEDTIFIVREVDEENYHTIYIDKTKESKFKKNQDKARVTTSLQQKIDVRVASYEDKEDLTDFGLPQFWLPLYRYKNEFYLYEPCDGIFEFKYLLTKEAVTHLFYDGPAISAIKRSERVNSQHYYFEFQESNPLDKLDVYIIDPKKKIAVFKFYENHQTFYQLFTTSSSLKSFDVIVNDCRTQKEREFAFEKVDFEALIEKIK